MRHAVYFDPDHLRRALIRAYMDKDRLRSELIDEARRKPFYAANMPPTNEGITMEIIDGAAYISWYARSLGNWE